MNTVVAFFSALVLAQPVLSQTGEGEGELKEIPVQRSGYEGMVYYLFIPKGAHRDRLYPLVFALHGNGSSAKAHARTITKVSTALLPVFVVAPQYQKEERFNAPVYPGAGAAFETILHATLADYPVDKSRVVLQGFSMGSNYSTAWINASASRQDADSTLPFRAVWLNSTAVPPREPAPKIPYLLFVGEKETAVLGRINVLESVRTAYKAMFKGGLDVSYVEIPGMGHAVNADCCHIMQEHLATLPDHTGAVPSKLASVFPRVHDLCLMGRFHEALKELDEVVASASTNRKSKARALRDRICSYLKELAASIGRTKHPMIADYGELTRLETILADRKELGQALASARKSLLKNKTLSLEIRAQAEFVAGQAIAGKDWTHSVAAIKAIADGPCRDTCYGLRARAHMQALGEDYSSPFAGAGGASRRNQKRRK